MLTFVDRIRYLREFDGSHTDLALTIMRADEGKFYSLDLLFLAALNRSKSNVSAFLQLIESQNYFAAAPFIRMQLDSVLRLYALRLVDDPNGLSHLILEGAMLNKTKDRLGNKMTDAYLRECVAKFEPWISKVYESGSGFIHLSEKHIISLFTKVGDKGEVELAISATQVQITDTQKEEAVAAMHHVTALVIDLCQDWLKQKSRT